MAWDKVIPIITSGCVNLWICRFLQPVEDRAISMWEAVFQKISGELHILCGKRKIRLAHMIGNALLCELSVDTSCGR